MRSAFALNSDALPLLNKTVHISIFINEKYAKIMCLLCIVQLSGEIVMHFEGLLKQQTQLSVT